MSILVGIVCPEAIVVAADSHITEPGDGTFSSVDKISVVHFKCDEVLIAQAGLWSVTNRVVLHITEQARMKEITKAEDVLEIVEDSIRKTKQPLDDTQKQFVDENGALLMLAFYVGKKPHLYVVNVHSGSGISFPNERHFMTAGIGGSLATYLLDEYAPPKSSSDMAIAAAIFAIKKVKDTTKLCGGNTVVRRISHIYQFINMDKTSIGKSVLIRQDFVNLAEKRIISFDNKSKKNRDKRVFGILNKTGHELWQKHLKKVLAEQKAEDAEEAAAQKQSEEMLKKFQSGT